MPQFVEQPRVLDSNDGLVRKAGKERDLPIVERTNLLAKDDDDAYELVLREHRHAKRGPNATKLDRIDSNWMTFGVSLSRCEVGDVDCLLTSNHLVKGTPRGRLERAALATRLAKCRRQIVARDHP